MGEGGEAGPCERASPKPFARGSPRVGYSRYWRVSPLSSTARIQPQGGERHHEEISSLHGVFVAGGAYMPLFGMCAIPVIEYRRVAPTALLRAQSTALSYRQHLPPGAPFRLGPLPRTLCQDARPTPFWPQFQNPRVRAYARTLPSPDLARGASQSVPDCAEAQGAHGNLHSEKPPAQSPAALVPKDARPADLAALSAPSWHVPRLASA